MAHYIHDDLNNRIEGLSKEEIYALIDQVIESGELPTSIQGAFVTAIKSIIDGKAYKQAFCTQAQYNELESQGELQADTVYFIVDDETYDDLVERIESLETSIESLETTTTNLGTRVTALENKELYQHTILCTDTIEIDANSYMEIHVVFDVFSTNNIGVQSLADLKSLMVEQKPYKASGYKRLYTGSSWLGSDAAFLVAYEFSNVNVYYNDTVSLALTNNATFVDSIQRIV